MSRCINCGEALTGKQKHIHDAAHDKQRIEGSPEHQDHVATMMAAGTIVKADDLRTPLTGVEIAAQQATKTEN